MSYQVRLVEKKDRNSIIEVLDSIELFPSEYLDGMISDYFTNPATEEIWFTCTINEYPIAIGYCVPEKLTDRTFNLLAIGVLKELQGQGIGKLMMEFIEQYLTENKKRILIVDTSSDEIYNATREFYKKINYIEIARIKDFWKDGEDKITFWKKLSY